MKDLPAYQEQLNSAVDGAKYTVRSAMRELLADFMGDALADPVFLQELVNDNPSKFKAIFLAQ